MKSIKEVGTTSVVFRLNKVSKFVNPYYIFEMINQNSKEKILFTGDDISPAPLSYNKFDWVNGVTFSATQSRFDLDPGNYFLNIYETEYQYNLNLGSASLLYDNEIKIEDDEICPPQVYFDVTDNDTFVYFDCDYESPVGPTESVCDDLNLVVYDNNVDFNPIDAVLQGDSVYLWAFDTDPFSGPSWNPTLYTWTVPDSDGNLITVTTSTFYYEWVSEGTGLFELKVTAENSISSCSATYSFVVFLL